ncbi:hypothetical protein SUGI_0598160 [Cryptomeria japonica]|nr:hypothetical protein SUGI_0598160 [Cryptomeria japonica]
MADRRAGERNLRDESREYARGNRDRSPDRRKTSRRKEDDYRDERHTPSPSPSPGRSRYERHPPSQNGNSSPSPLHGKRNSDRYSPNPQSNPNYSRNPRGESRYERERSPIAKPSVYRNGHRDRNYYSVRESRHESERSGSPIPRFEDYGVSNPRRNGFYDMEGRSPSPIYDRRGSPSYNPYKPTENRQAFLERDARRHEDNQSESDDEELKGLDFAEYRRLKRQKLRRKLKNCIWKITPSPSREEMEFDPSGERPNIEKTGIDRYVNAKLNGKNDDHDSEDNAQENKRNGTKKKDSGKYSDRGSDDGEQGKKRYMTKKGTGKYSDSESDDGEQGKKRYITKKGSRKYSDSESKGQVKKRDITKKRSRNYLDGGSEDDEQGKKRVLMKKRSQKYSDSGSDDSDGSMSEKGLDDDVSSESDDRRKERKKRGSSSRKKRSRGSHKSRQMKAINESESESSEEVSASVGSSSYSSEEERPRKKSKQGSKYRKPKKRSKRKVRRSKRSKTRSSKDGSESATESEDGTNSSDKEGGDSKIPKLARVSKQTDSRKHKQQSPSENNAFSEPSNSDSEPVGIEDDKEDKSHPVEIDDEALMFKEMIESQKKSAAAGLENEPFVGPAPAPRAEGHISYGGALRPGEGDAIAQYVQQGKRIPRRGEVGLSADEIQKFESLGYVMSGSRHQRMNAIRIRKENQVYSAEDKRALAMFNYEEKAKREHKVMSDLQRLVQRHIGQDVGPTHDPFAANASEVADG